MNTETAAVPRKAGMHRYRHARTTISRFVARRTYRSAVLWAVIFVTYVASKASGVIAAYPTEASRATFVAAFGHNLSITALLGPPSPSATAPSFVGWNCSAAMVIIGAIWALLLATKTFRGEEDAGRWELLLAGQTTARRAAANALAGLGMSLLGLFGILAVGFCLIGRLHGLDFNAQAATFFALSASSGAAVFMVVGAVTSQLMPTRRLAAGVAAVIFGICFLIKVLADVTNLHWLLDVTPLGWIEQLRPLAGSHWLWFVPIVITILVLSGVTLWLAGARDLNTSVFTDHDTAAAHLRLLGSPLGLATRLTRAVNLGWLAALVGVFVFFASFTKIAVQAFGSSSGVQKIFNTLVHTSQLAIIQTWLGFIFLFMFLLLMAYAASALGAMREDEAEGYLDNLLVRSVGRLQWLFGRLAIVAGVIVGIALLSTVLIWLIISAQHEGVPFHTLWLAGLNALAPAIFVAGLGTLALGLVPRLTTAVAYGVIAWSFLIYLVSSGIHLSHWLLDTSILQQVALAPAASPKWTPDVVLGLLGVGLALLGSLIFNRRDLQSE